jgi:hypothetical protein
MFADPLDAPASPREAALREGGVKGRNPSRFAALADCVAPRCASVLEPVLLRSALASDERLLLPGGVNERIVPADEPVLERCAVVAAPAPRAADSPAPSRPPAGIAPTWFCAMLCRRLAVCCWNDCGREALLCTAPKKCSEPPRIVDGAAARPLAERLEREGTTGRLPAIMRAPLNCERLAAAGVTRPAPK